MLSSVMGLSGGVCLGVISEGWMISAASGEE